MWEGQGGQWLTRGVENTNMTDCISSLNTSIDDIQGLVSLQLFRPWLKSFEDEKAKIDTRGVTFTIKTKKF